MMIRIDLDKIEPTIEKLVEQKLEEANLPSCIGMLSLPLLRSSIEFQEEDLLKPIRSLFPDERTTHSLGEFSNYTPGSDMVLTLQGFKKIIKYKEDAVKKYVDQCIKCTKCQYVDICDRLTKNTIEQAKMYNEVIG